MERERQDKEVGKLIEKYGFQKVVGVMSLYLRIHGSHAEITENTIKDIEKTLEEGDAV